MGTRARSLDVAMLLTEVSSNFASSSRDNWEPTAFVGKSSDFLRWLLESMGSGEVRVLTRKRECFKCSWGVVSRLGFSVPGMLIYFVTIYAQYGIYLFYEKQLFSVSRNKI